MLEKRKKRKKKKKKVMAWCRCRGGGADKRNILFLNFTYCGRAYMTGILLFSVWNVRECQGISFWRMSGNPDKASHSLNTFQQSFNAFLHYSKQYNVFQVTIKS